MKRKLIHLSILAISLMSIGISLITAFAFDESKHKNNNTADLDSLHETADVSVTSLDLTDNPISLTATSLEIFLRGENVDPLHTSTPRPTARTLSIPASTLSSSQQLNTPQVATPDPTPTFLPSVFVEVSQSSIEGICVTQYPGAFWFLNEGNELLSRTFVFIDGHQLSEDDYFLITVMDTSYVIRDSDGNILGSYSGPMTFCFDTYNLAKGDHELVIQIETGEFTYDYSWSFNIAE